MFKSTEVAERPNPVNKWGASGGCLVALSAALAAAAIALPAIASEACCDPKGPFREGEAGADIPATCENLAYWAQKAPDTTERISMVVTGRISGVHSDGVLAYLEMCEAKGLRAVCITYSTNGMRVGEIVTFAGGFGGASEQWVKLDPCLASRAGARVWG